MSDDFPVTSESGQKGLPKLNPLRSLVALNRLALLTLLRSFKIEGPVSSLVIIEIIPDQETNLSTAPIGVRIVYSWRDATFIKYIEFKPEVCTQQTVKYDMTRTIADGLSNVIRTSITVNGEPV